jgi:hypothetical protein
MGNILHPVVIRLRILRSAQRAITSTLFAENKEQASGEKITGETNLVF